MGRELSMVRKLEKIEKEMGYCQIKLEKAARLRVQLRFLKLHERSLAESIARFRELAGDSDLHGNELAGVRLDEVYHAVTLNDRTEQAEEFRQAFRVAGALGMLEHERDLLERETDDLEARLDTFDVFSAKQELLTTEREHALLSFHTESAEPIAEISREFDQIESNWNGLTEDLMNLDEAVKHVGHAADYLRSARGFILAGRSQFTIETWLREGYLLDLFKHTSVGRAKEMVEGADRNLKVALRELICLDEVTIDPDDFEHLLLPFLDALFGDLFVSCKLRKTMELLEDRISRLERLFGELDRLRDDVFTLQSEQEQQRVRLFTQIGDERRKLPLAT